MFTRFKVTYNVQNKALPLISVSKIIYNIHKKTKLKYKNNLISDAVASY